MQSVNITFNIIFNASKCFARPRLLLDNCASIWLYFNRDAVVALVIKSVKNPRSALCKTALMTSTDMFKAYQDQLLDLLDPLV